MPKKSVKKRRRKEEKGKGKGKDVTGHVVGATVYSRGLSGVSHASLREDYNSHPSDSAFTYSYDYFSQDLGE